MLALLALAVGLVAAHSHSGAHRHIRRSTPAELYRRAAGIPIPKDGYPEDKNPPEDWAYENLELYYKYHFRYLQINCQNMHDTEFFDTCCHPRKFDAKDEDIPFECELQAHITGVPPKKLNKAINVANKQADVVRNDQIESIHSVSSASIASIASEKSASKHSRQSAASASSESIASRHSAHLASVSSESAASASSKAEKTAKPSSSPEPEPTSHHQKPTPTPTPTTSSPESQPTTSADSSGSGSSGGDGGSSSGSSGSGQFQYGSSFGMPSFATYYYQAGTIGACGLQSAPIPDSQHVIALRYDLYAELKGKCGQNVIIKNVATGATTTAMFNDECEGCDTKWSIDLSYGAFGAIADYSQGEVAIEWGFIDG